MLDAFLTLLIFFSLFNGLLTWDISQRSSIPASWQSFQWLPYLLKGYFCMWSVTSGHNPACDNTNKTMGQIQAKYM